MATEKGSEYGPKNRTTAERRSDRELVLTRTFNGRARIVFDAWTKPDLLKRWWAPKALGVSLFSCEADVRAGGSYRYVFGHDPEHPMVFSGNYTEVTPYTRLVWTQVLEQMRAAGEAIITATFNERDGKTELVLHQLFPSKEALEGAIASGMEKGTRETFEQLEELLGSLH